MSRRPGNIARRLGDSGSVPFVGALHQKSRSSPFLSVGLVLVGALLLIGYSYSGSGGFAGNKEAVSKLEGGLSCTSEVQTAIPILKKAYGDGMRKVLHVGPDTCSVVSRLFKEEDTEAWGVEPYEIEDTDGNCKSLLRKGIVRVADIKFPLPYREKSFNLVIVSDALDYLSPKYLNKTLPDLARVSIDGIVIFAEVSTLRDQMLLLGDNTSISLLASDYPGCKPNCIYFTNDFHNAGVFLSNDVGVFDLEDGSVLQHYSSLPINTSIWPTLIWVEPETRNIDISFVNKENTLSPDLQHRDGIRPDLSAYPVFNSFAYFNAPIC